MAVMEPNWLTGELPDAKDWLTGLSPREFINLHVTRHIATDKRLDNGAICIRKNVDDVMLSRHSGRDIEEIIMQRVIMQRLSDELNLKVSACVECESLDVKSEAFLEPSCMNKVFTVSAFCKRGHDGCNKRITVATEPRTEYMALDPVAKHEVKPDVPVTAVDAW